MMATTTRNSVSVDTEKWLQVLRIMVLTVSMVHLKAIQTNIGIQFLYPVSCWLWITSSIPNGYSVLKSSLNPVVRVLLMNLRIRKTVSMKRRWKGWRSGYRAIPHYPFNCSTIQHTCRSRHCPGRIDQRPS